MTPKVRPRRRRRERVELIERAATGKGLVTLVLSLFVGFSFLGSSARAIQTPGPALGSMDISRPEFVEDSSAKVEGDGGLYYSVYRVERGDTLSGIAELYDVSLDTVISFNEITNARSLQPGKLLKIPSMSGILYEPKEGDTAHSVAAANEISADRIIEANGLMRPGLEPGRTVFLPDARLASFKLREISGDLFYWPARGWVTSWYGYRNDPFTGARRFHNGLDIGVDLGTSVQAPMDGTVAETGYSSGSGNYVFLVHHAGWSSFFGHLESVSVKAGQRVRTGNRLGFSGNTGYSTGPHLHFSVFKNGRSVNPTNVLR